MADHDRSRTGLQTAADFARFARSVVRIAKAAATSGLQGAAIAAAKESLPLLIKLCICILVVLLTLPILIFTALPNIFFGYDSSKTGAVIGMTRQAMQIGGAYMSLEDFENTQMDSLVTSIASEYEERGDEISHIEVNSDFDEDDLLWFIAINSVDYRQDLNEMDAEEIRQLGVSRLHYFADLITDGDGSSILQITVEHLDPDDLMDQLSFDDDARIWAGALYETLAKSDVLERYASYFEPYRPSYGGDTSYGGSVEHGGSYKNEIDISQFVEPDSKNNLDLAAYAIQAWENNWGYVWGTYGNVLTESLFQYKLQQYPDGVGNYEGFIREHWLDRRTADCVGLIKGYGWLDADTLTINYATNGMPDYGANQMYQAAVDSGADHGSMPTLPEIPGLAVWKSGHIGIYIGGGYVVEAMSTKNGVVRTEVEGRGWVGWCKIPYIEYLEES